jgi:DNA invertase Pin-like site-specific DNA recombinase
MFDRRMQAERFPYCAREQIGVMAYGSLAYDFAKIVEILDARRASFVSVTQQFNTTTSMGRLTLNILLSFAQFEREVIGERIRDKIAASADTGSARVRDRGGRRAGM